jgi:organic radical activating enzyme
MQGMPPLPEHLQSAVRIKWTLSHWCNYQCDYCGVPVFSRRDKERQPHAFDYYSVQEWLKAFDKFPQDQIRLTVAGGEPFVDRKNVAPMLDGLLSADRYTIEIYTNGFWNPIHYTEVRNKHKVELLVSFHSSQTDFATFHERLMRIRDAGFTISRVIIVLAPENMATIESSLRQLMDDGFWVTVTPMIPAGLHMHSRKRTEEMKRIIEEYVLPTSAYFLILNPVTQGRACFHPALAYTIGYDGAVAVSCIGKPVNIFKDPLPELPREAVPCPHRHCYGCPDMVRSIDDPINTKPLTVFYDREYVNELREFHAARTRDPLHFRNVLSKFTFPGTTEDYYTRFSANVLDMPLENPVSIVLDDEIGQALPDAPVFGYMDRMDGTEIVQAKAADRIMLSGWAVSTRSDAPVSHVSIAVNGDPIGAFEEFYPRPEVAKIFARKDFLESGFQGLCFVPRLRPGDYPLVATAKNIMGETYQLPALVMRITG